MAAVTQCSHQAEVSLISAEGEHYWKWQDEGSTLLSEHFVITAASVGRWGLPGGRLAVE